MSLQKERRRRSSEGPEVIAGSLPAAQGRSCSRGAGLRRVHTLVLSQAPLTSLSPSVRVRAGGLQRFSSTGPILQLSLGAARCLPYPAYGLSPCCPCSRLDVGPVTGGTLPVSSSLCPQDQAAPVALQGRASIWHGRPAAGHGAELCVPAGNICPGPPRKHLGTVGRRGQLEQPSHPGRGGDVFWQELNNFRLGRCGREGGNRYAPGAFAKPGGSVRRRRAAWAQVAEEDTGSSAVELEGSAMEVP